MNLIKTMLPFSQSFLVNWILKKKHFEISIHVQGEKCHLRVWDYTLLQAFNAKVKYIGHEGVIFLFFLWNHHNLGASSVDLVT